MSEIHSSAPHLEQQQNHGYVEHDAPWVPSQDNVIPAPFFPVHVNQAPQAMNFGPPQDLPNYNSVVVQPSYQPQLVQPEISNGKKTLRTVWDIHFTISHTYQPHSNANTRTRHLDCYTVTFYGGPQGGPVMRAVAKNSEYRLFTATEAGIAAAGLHEPPAGGILLARHQDTELNVFPAFSGGLSVKFQVQKSGGFFSSPRSSIIVSENCRIDVIGRGSLLGFEMHTKINTAGIAKHTNTSSSGVCLSAYRRNDKIKGVLLFDSQELRKFLGNSGNQNEAFLSALESAVIILNVAIYKKLRRRRKFLLICPVISILLAFMIIAAIVFMGRR